jgi:hypothetical protein
MDIETTVNDTLETASEDTHTARNLAIAAAATAAVVIVGRKVVQRVRAKMASEPVVHVITDLPETAPAEKQSA